MAASDVIDVYASLAGDVDVYVGDAASEVDVYASLAGDVDVYVELGE